MGRIFSLHTPASAVGRHRVQVQVIGLVVSSHAVPQKCDPLAIRRPGRIVVENAVPRKLSRLPVRQVHERQFILVLVRRLSYIQIAGGVDHPLIVRRSVERCLRASFTPYRCVADLPQSGPIGPHRIHVRARTEHYLRAVGTQLHTPTPPPGPRTKRRRARGAPVRMDGRFLDGCPPNLRRCLDRQLDRRVVARRRAHQYCNQHECRRCRDHNPPHHLTSTGTGSRAP